MLFVYTMTTVNKSSDTLSDLTAPRVETDFNMVAAIFWTVIVEAVRPVE